MPLWLILTATALYMAGLFAIAWRGDARAEATGRSVSPLVYTLALAVYCTSWTFYGAVGTAASSGWDYLPIYLGPALVFLIFPSVIKRIGDIAQRESVTSLSDFLAARYGKSRLLAATATLAAVAGSLPYIALQLKSVGMSLDALSLNSSAGGASVLLTAIALALFAIAFGARHPDMTQRNAGLMQVLAFESVIKLAALLAVCILSLAMAGEAPPERLRATEAQFASLGPLSSFLTITLLSMAAVICLPRQFHVAVIERGHSRDLRLASWLFPAYLAVTSLVVLPITLAGASLLPAGTSPDLFVIALPLAHGESWLALLVFLGGFSAASGMVIVSSVALSTMVTNDLIVPALMRSGRISDLGAQAGRRLVMIRRAVILALLLLAYGYFSAAGSSEALAQIGLLSFAAAIQFAPCLISAVYWRTGHRNGAVAGLITGMAIWAYCLFVPALFGIDALRSAGLAGPLDPHGLLGVELADPLTHGVVWSLLANTLIFVIFSIRARVRLRDRIQAAVFTNLDHDRAGGRAGLSGGASGATPDGLKALASRFLAPEAVDLAFDKFEADTGLAANGDAPADWRLVQRTERLLASALGASSARVVMASALAGSAVALGDVLSILDQQTQAQRFDRHMLQSMLENVSQGISVVDHDQRLVAWNSAYVELFSYPAQLIRLGRPIADLIAHNIARGWIEADDETDEINRRIAHMKSGSPHNFERRNPDGTWLRIAGSPMPGGGYVTTFTDITEDKRRETALLELNESLEARVEARTEDLRQMAVDLDAARREAEKANASKTSFLAAASHDLLQPLNAARLFLGALSDKEGDETRRELISRTDRAIESADQLLKGLLDISRLDQGEVTAKPDVLPVGPLLEDLVDEARPMARQVGLDIRLVATSLSVRADPDFLQSILRNFISNARRYTQSGAILVGARRRGGRVRLEVWDTGPGIPAGRQAAVFDAFRRFEEADNAGTRGAGLGLAIATRLARLMDGRVGVKSRPGHGSVFWLDIERAMSRHETEALGAEAASVEVPAAFSGLRILCVDDERAILDGMDAVLRAWGCQSRTATDKASALAEYEAFGPDIVLVDLRLQGDETGFDIVDEIRVRDGRRTACALLTASASEDTHAEAARRGMEVLAKPVDPARLRTLLARLAGARPAQAAE